MHNKDLINRQKGTGTMNKYLIIGDGRCSRHFRHYLKSLDIPCSTWARSQFTNKIAQRESLIKKSAEATRTLLLIRDDQLELFLQNHPQLRKPTTIHFSGSKTVAGISGVHPLMTFGPELYSLDVYQGMPFIVEDSAPDFAELFPELKNPHAKITANKKSLYHALCVMSGNFTTLLWENVARTFTKEMGLSSSLLLPYLTQTAINNLKTLESSGHSVGASALTGPIARGDVQTIIRNIDSLAGLPERDLYYAFLNYALANGQKIGDLPNDHLAI